MSEDTSGKMAEVLRLSMVEGLSLRAISRKLSMSRKSVRKILGRTLPSERPPAKQPRHSILDAYEATIRATLADTPDLLAPSMLERLRPLGYTGGISILRDRMRTLRPHAPKEAFLTLDFLPGSVLQVDWADFGFAIPGCPRRVSAFVSVLGYSRHLYLEYTLSQRMGAFLRCMENAIAFYGGITHTDVFDNMKTVVLERTKVGAVFNPRFRDYAAVRGFAITACNPRRGNEKGVVERGIGFVRRRFWPGRKFRDLLDLNRQAAEWREVYANNRIHEVTGKVPSLVFGREERKHLKPVTARPFDTDDVESCGVTKSFRVRFDRNLYSVPWRLVSQQVVVRANTEQLGVFLERKQVALHSRCWDVGRDIEHASHKKGLLKQKPRAAAGTLPHALSGLSDVGKEYFKLLGAGGRSIHREVVRLVLLVELFGAKHTADAIREVMDTGHIGSEYVEYVLRHKRNLDPSPPLLRLGDPELDDIRLPEPDMSVYDPPSPPRKMLDPGSPANDGDEDDTDGS